MVVDIINIIVNDWWEIGINKNESVIVQTQDELYENKIKMK